MFRISHQLLVDADAGDHAVDARAFEVERRRGDVPAAVQLADEAVARDAYVLEEQLVERVPVRQVVQRAHLDARRLHVEQEVADSFVFRCVRIGTSEQNAPVRFVRE